VDLEGVGIGGGCFAHGSFEWPDNLSGGGIIWDVGLRRNHRCSFWQGEVWGKMGEVCDCLPWLAVVCSCCQRGVYGCLQWLTIVDGGLGEPEGQRGENGGSRL
jgi:hypothetical protein